MSWLVNITISTHINYPVISIFLSSIRYGLQYLFKYYIDSSECLIENIWKDPGFQIDRYTRMQYPGIR